MPVAFGAVMTVPGNAFSKLAKLASTNSPTVITFPGADPPRFCFLDPAEAAPSNRVRGIAVACAVGAEAEGARGTVDILPTPDAPFLLQDIPSALVRVPRFSFSLLISLFVCD